MEGEEFEDARAGGREPHARMMQVRPPTLLCQTEADVALKVMLVQQSSEMRLDRAVRRIFWRVLSLAFSRSLFRSLARSLSLSLSLILTSWCAYVRRQGATRVTRRPSKATW